MRMKELRWSVVKGIIFNIGTVIFRQSVKSFQYGYSLSPEMG